MEDDIVGEENTEISQFQKPLAIVNRDFRRAKQYLSTWHNECIERYQHYKAAGLARNIFTDNKLPVPFTPEQVDQLRADMMEKLWHKNEPCGIYGRNETDQADADAKREFMAYQDREDGLYEKVDAGVLHCGIYGIAPAVVNYREDFEVQPTTKVVPVTFEDGTLVTDINGMPQYSEEPTMAEVPVYQGASVELIDIIDLFWTKEKREIYDEHPFMIRSRRTLEWFKDKSYIIQEQVARLEMDKENPNSDTDDLLSDKRGVTGYDDNDENKNEYQYVEWYGYGDFGEGRALYIVGVANGRYVLRMDKANDVFGLGHPNIIIGTIDKEFGEVRGQSLLDKFHSLQHTMDTLMGMWIENLKQSVNRMWVVDNRKLKNRMLVNKPGFVINTEDDINKVAKVVDQPPISQDIYAGMEMVRRMAQNASGLSDISEGIAQEGVETLGEASILQAQSGLRVKNYLRCFEVSFIQPLWEMRNQINMRFVNDVGYLYSIIEENVVNWRTIKPAQVRANVDFVCEASNRENQKAVITQQILQALNIVTGMTMSVGPIPALMLLKKLYQDAFGWSEEDIVELLPLEPIVGQMMQNQMQSMAQSPASMGQPKSEGDAIQGANQRNSPNVGQVA